MASRDEILEDLFQQADPAIYAQVLEEAKDEYAMHCLRSETCGEHQAETFYHLKTLHEWMRGIAHRLSSTTPEKSLTT